jgi:3'(2'), 5'-bisphosphate nucleotidase
MTLSPDLAPSLEDHHLARDIAAEAGRRLCALRERGDRNLGALGDRLSDDYIHQALADSRPADHILSEESPDDPSRLRADRVWIVDPLDGTREFAEPGRTDWAVHVALWERRTTSVSGRDGMSSIGFPAVGAVALPAQRSVFSTANPPLLPAVTAGRRLRIVVSRSRPPRFAGMLAEQLDAYLMAIGSAGAKIAAVLAGDADVYVHAGGQYEWDSAAPVAVARAAGLHTPRLDASPFLYNQPDPRVPDLLVCRPEIADAVLKRTRELSSPEVPS